MFPLPEQIRAAWKGIKARPLTIKEPKRDYSLPRSMEPASYALLRAIEQKRIADEKKKKALKKQQRKERIALLNRVRPRRAA